MNLFPPKVMPYAKAWASLVGVVLAGVVAAVPDLPKWLAVVAAAFGTAAVYMSPKNEDKTG